MKKNSKLRALLTAVVMVLPLAFGFVGNGVQAAEKDTQTVTLHKMAYDEMPEPTTPNTGDEMDFGGKPLAGAVFTAYDVTKEYWETYDTTEAQMELKQMQLKLVYLH
ncbi:pilin N-terminal domain-containing protein [Enterococcus asini]|uniref:pilin N-terminal domain-containing protein n=1 Tax=Enterococcus asini TaxID=57732 RepID=UPI0015F3ED4D|nr:pilin N-terminal domain-containing protein [Enterococcus asini]